MTMRIEEDHIALESSKDLCDIFVSYNFNQPNLIDIQIYIDPEPNNPAGDVIYGDPDIIEVTPEFIDKLMEGESFTVETTSNNFNVEFVNLNGQWDLIVSYKNHEGCTIEFSEYADDEIEVNEFVNTIIEHYVSNH